MARQTIASTNATIAALATAQADMQAQISALVAALNPATPAKVAKTRKPRVAKTVPVQAPVVAPVLVKVAKTQPAALVAAKSHCRDARLARRASTKHSGLAGLTKSERSALYAANPQLSKLSADARKAAWVAIVAAHKAA